MSDVKWAIQSAKVVGLYFQKFSNNFGQMLWTTDLGEAKLFHTRHAAGLFAMQNIKTSCIVVKVEGQLVTRDDDSPEDAYERAMKGI